MRTVPLLVAVLLLAVQAQAEPIRESPDEVQAQEMPEAQETPEAQDEDVAISFAGDGISTREASAPQRKFICFCRTGQQCKFLERHSGICWLKGNRYRFCCRRAL